MAGFFFANIILLPFVLSGMPERYQTYISLSVTLICLDILLYIIYATEKVYWINGLSFEDAKKMTSQARRTYAAEHLRRFVNASLVWLLYGAVKVLFSIGLWWDILVFLILVITTAVSTIGIKPEKE